MASVYAYNNTMCMLKESEQSKVHLHQTKQTGHEINSFSNTFVMTMKLTNFGM